MYIKKLIVENLTEVIRDIDFKIGLNVIIDNTPTAKDNKKTGNNVGKTTVLKLIDICLGADANIVYKDNEDKKKIYSLVKDYLMENETLITLILAEDLDDDKSKTIVIKRNFLLRTKAIRQINGENYQRSDYAEGLFRSLIGDEVVKKPTFRQIISHYIRYNDRQINNTLKILDPHTTDVAYESLMLYVLGCNYNDGARKQILLENLKQEQNFKQRLERKETKNAYEIALSMLNDEIIILDKKKSNLNLNENFDNDLDALNIAKYQINRCTSLISKLNIRKEIIIESLKDLEDCHSSIDLQKLKQLYDEVSINVSDVHKSFSDLVGYHNKMLLEKSKFIKKELTPLNMELDSENTKLEELLNQEKILSKKIAKSDTFEDLEEIIIELNSKYKEKGEYDIVISQLVETDSNIEKLEMEIEEIESVLFSPNFEELLKTQISKFNKLFSSISYELYGEKYALKYDKEINAKSGKLLYKFNAFNLNMSTGKKQGEILCYDLAYILFAEQEDIPCFHFLLNDKKELMHINQLTKVAKFVKDKKIQLVISILNDKLTEEVRNNAHIAVLLSQEEKLFKIE